MLTVVVLPDCTPTAGTGCLSAFAIAPEIGSAWTFGREPRYLLFINVPLMRMFQYLGLRDPEDIRSDYRGLYVGHRFMSACSVYPVVRLQIDPGEAYIMPADNLLHDASTERTRFPDITLTFLGYLRSVRRITPFQRGLVQRFGVPDRIIVLNGPTSFVELRM